MDIDLDFNPRPESLFESGSFLDSLSSCPQKIVGCVGSVFKSFLTDYSIFHAFDAERLSKEREENLDLSSFQKIELGMRAGVSVYFRKYALLRVVSMLALWWFGEKLLKGEGSPTSASPESLKSSFVGFSKIPYLLFYCTFVAPLFEELFFRKGIQGTLENLAFPPILQITLSTVPFALLHESFRTRCYIFSSPFESILYYTTGSIEAPLAGHITNNGLVVLNEVAIRGSRYFSKK